MISRSFAGTLRSGRITSSSEGISCEDQSLVALLWPTDTADVQSMGVVSSLIGDGGVVNLLQVSAGKAPGMEAAESIRLRSCRLWTMDQARVPIQVSTAFYVVKEQERRMTEVGVGLRVRKQAQMDIWSRKKRSRVKRRRSQCALIRLALPWIR